MHLKKNNKRNKQTEHNRLQQDSKEKQPKQGPKWPAHVLGHNKKQCEKMMIFQINP